MVRAFITGRAQAISRTDFQRAREAPRGRYADPRKAPGISSPQRACRSGGPSNRQTTFFTVSAWKTSPTCVDARAYIRAFCEGARMVQPGLRDWSSVGSPKCQMMAANYRSIGA